MLFFHGLGLGFAIAAPVGVIGLLCIQRTIVQGRWIGFLSGMGAATADGIYGCIAGFGLSAIADLLVAQRQWFLLLGGLFLCYLGITTFRQPPPPSNAPPQTTQTALKAYVSVLLLTLTNPLTIFSFLGIFSGLGLGQTPSDHGGAIALVLGVFCGSALWWLLLSTGVAFFSRQFVWAKLVWLNRVSGIAIVGLGVLALGRLLVP